MTFAALSNEAVEQVAEVVKEVMAGTPDAARKEPFTWITWIGITVVLTIVAGFLLKLLQSNSEQTKAFVEQSEKFTESVQKNNVHNISQAEKCHANQLATIKIASDAAHAAASATHETKQMVSEVRSMVGKVMEKLS